MPIVELHLVKRGQKKSEGRHPKSQRSVGISGTVQYAVAAKQSAYRAFQYYGSTTHFNGFYLQSFIYFAIFSRRLRCATLGDPVWNRYSHYLLINL